MPDTVRTRDIEYLRSGDQPLLARLYEPEGDGPFPALVDVHGGVWTTHDRLQNASIHAELAAAGIVVAALDFRMPPAARYPDPVAEINFGIRWFKSHAAEFRTRPELIGGLGTSSGGHQLMLNVLAPNDPQYAAIPGDGTADATLRFVIVGWGVVDPLARYHMARVRGLTRIVDAHHAYWPSEAAMGAGNPQLMLEAGTAAALPPLLYLQGTDDDNLTPDMAQRFTAAYRAAGGRAELEIFAGQGHTFVTKDPASADAVRARALIAAFVRESVAQP
jgi:acetyl esterase/lipase